MIEDTLKALTVAINNLAEKIERQNDVKIVTANSPAPATKRGSQPVPLLEPIAPAPAPAPELVVEAPAPKPVNTALDTIAKLKAKAKAEKAEAKPEIVNEAGATVVTYTPPAPTPEPAPVEKPVVKNAKIDLMLLTETAQRVLDFKGGLDALRELNKRHEIERISKTPAEKMEAVHLDLVALLTQFEAKK